MHSRVMTAGRSVGSVAVAVLLVIGCGGGPAATSRVPDATPAPPTTPPAETTPQAEITPSPVSTDNSSTILDAGTGWSTTVEVTLSTGIYTDEFAEGSFTSTGATRLCGTTMFFPSGFLYEFPNDLDPRQIEDVAFGATELLPGTTTSSFSISVSISAEAAGGGHPKTYLDPSAGTGNSGTAQLTIADGERRLVLDAAGEGGVTVHLTAVCTST